MRSHIKGLVTAFFVSVLFTLSGCSKMSTDYGATRGIYGKTSLNGFGALRQSYVQAGFRSRDVKRLTNRVQQTDVIVWTPKLLSPVANDVTRWFDRWLSRGNRTLVYIVPDSGSEADYWADASKLAPASQRLEYRRRAARSVNERMMWRMNRTNVQSNGWFRIEPLVLREPIGEVEGTWKEGFADKGQASTDLGLEFRIVAYDRDDTSPGAVFNPAINGPTGPGTPQWSYPEETSPTSTSIQFNPVLESESGSPLVVEVSAGKWPNSRILVVSGGSLLTNYAYTRPFNRTLADRIIEESTPTSVADPTAGFLTSDWNGISVSETKAGVPEATGMEILTVWPLSVVTMHGLMLGLVICMMLVPIFGRPRRIHKTNESEFGHHLDAVAALMNKSGGEPYARARISEYFKRMHGETQGPWVLPDPPPPPAKPTPTGGPTLKPGQLSGRRLSADPQDPAIVDSASPTAADASSAWEGSQLPGADSQNGPNSDSPNSQDEPRTSPDAPN